MRYRSILVPVQAICLADIAITYEKWGGTQHAKKGDWLLSKDGEVAVVNKEIEERVPLEVIEAIDKIIKKVPPNMREQGLVAGQLMAAGEFDLAPQVLGMKPADYAYLVFLLCPPREDFTIE